jgi:transposase
MSAAFIGLDLAKSVFQVHGVDVHGKVVVTKRLRRDAVLAFFANLAPCVVGMEACAGSHFWPELTKRPNFTYRVKIDIQRNAKRKETHSALDGDTIM